MNSSPKISVIVPTLNKKKYVEDTFKSIVRQKYHQLEVLICDGGSTDGTLEIILKYTSKYPTIFFLVSKKDNGQCDAINIGFRKATGNILTFINADDVYCNNVFIEISRLYSKYPKSLWFVGRGETVNNSGLPILKIMTYYKNFLLMRNKFNNLLIVNYIFQPSVFITKEAFREFGPFTGLKNGVVIEYSMWLKIASKQMPVLSNKIMSRFRLLNESLSLSYYKEILNNDYEEAKKYSKNYSLLFLHDLHNKFRILLSLLINEN